jgi:thiol:disulfide interchange protein DsbA
MMLALALAPLLVRAQRAGTDYTVLRPEQPVEAPGRIEVIEFFWYGCIHCYNLEPLVEAWEAKLPPDVQLRRVPAVFNPRWAHDAAIFYAFEALGVLEKVNRPFYDAIHRDRLRTDDAQALAQWLQKNGLDPAKVDGAMKSFGVQSKVRRAAQLTKAYRIDGTPAFAVHGRYTVSAEQGRTREGTLALVDHLVGLTRKSLSARK